MLLGPQDLNLFIRMQQAFLFFVNQRLQVLPDKTTSLVEFAATPPQLALKVRDAFLANTGLLQAFIDENPAGFSEAELEIVRSWRHLVAGKFYIFRHLKNYSVFLSATDPAIAYGVLSLGRPLEVLAGPNLPVLVQAVLLPFQGKIIYDGLMPRYSIAFGPDLRQSLNESYNAAKQRHGIVTSLPMSSEPPPRKAAKAKPAPKPPTKQDKDEALRNILSLLEPFCQEYLNDEYALLCRKMAEKLARKRPSPLLHGGPNAWASGIVRAVGAVNFLHDKSQTPYMRSADIDHALGTSPSSGAAKLAMIRKMLKIYEFDPDWTLPSRLEDNPIIWMLSVDGFIMDVRNAPREVQEQAFLQGLIPYIPADRE
jgi:hypothetical protein